MTGGNWVPALLGAHVFLRWRAARGVAAREALRLLTKIRGVVAAAVHQRARRADVRVPDRARVCRALLSAARGARELARGHIAARIAAGLRLPVPLVLGAAARRAPAHAHVRVGQRTPILALTLRLRAPPSARHVPLGTVVRIAARPAHRRVDPRLLRVAAAAGARAARAVVLVGRCAGRRDALHVGAVPTQRRRVCRNSHQGHSDHQSKKKGLHLHVLFLCLFEA